MRPRTQRQPQVKKELCQVLDDVGYCIEDSNGFQICIYNNGVIKLKHIQMA